MIINREWAMPNHETFSIRPIKELIERHWTTGIWIDPFARNSPFNDRCFATNDLSPEANTTHHMESLNFLDMLADDDTFRADGALFDPPYSPRQISECYKQVGRTVHQSDTQSSFYGDRKHALSQLIRPGGKVISFGWNSSGMGKKNGFEIIEILLVAHGGAHNDTICVVDKKL